MKKYVFLQPSICGMGGAQQYLFQKIETMEKMGWSTIIISAERGEILVESLKKYAKYVVEGLRYSTCYYNRIDQKKMLDEAIKYIAKQDDDELYIESATASLALWGEMIAERIHCRHICFDFEEIFTNLTKTQLEFVDYKHKRKELAGITTMSVPLMFKGYKEVSPDEAYCYRAMCSNPIANVRCELTGELTKYDCRIGTIGRAEKPYLIPSLERILAYTNEHPKVRYAVVLIGGAKEPKYAEEAEKLFRNAENVDFFSTGMIFPIPRELVHKIDVFVSSSGSANATARDGVPTIAVSPTTFHANGILDYTTRFAVLPKEEIGFDIKDMLYEVLDKQYCKHHDNLGIYGTIPYEELADAEYRKQVDFVLSCDAPLEYYDISKVKKEGRAYWIALVARIIGRDCFLTGLKLLEKSNWTLIKG